MQVHALRLVISLKMLVDPMCFGKDGTCDKLVHEINEELPSAIRVFGCHLMRRAFSARSFCTLREYEYLVPLSHYMGDIQRLDAALRLFEGTHSFMAFTPQKSALEMGRHASLRNVYWCHVMDTLSCENGVEFLRVRIAGQSFVQNQIRMMIGAALAVANGLMSEHEVIHALSTRRTAKLGNPETSSSVLKQTSDNLFSQRTKYYKMPPMAPASCLLQRDCAFRPTSRVHLETCAAALVGGRNSLLTTHGFAEARKFTENIIYPHISRLCAIKGGEDWQKWSQFMNIFSERTTTAENKSYRGRSVTFSPDKSLSTLEQQAETSIHGDKGYQKYPAALPRRLAAQLVTRFRLQPGYTVSDMQRYVADSIGTGNLPLSCNTQECLQFVVKTGEMEAALHGAVMRLSDWCETPT